MRAVETITYKKKNSNDYKVLVVNNFNFLKIKKEIFNKRTTSNILSIKDDIEYINFQNVDIPMLTNKTKYLSGISCDENTTCILNNCDIESKSNRFSLYRGKFKLINIDSEKDMTVEYKGYNDLSIKNLKCPTRCLKLTGIYDIPNIDIMDKYSFKEIYVVTNNNVSLKGDFLLSELIIRANNTLSIGHNEKPTNIYITDEKSADLVISGDNLKLNNCSIINYYESCNIIINYSSLELNNVKITSKGTIKINDSMIFDKKDENGFVTMTDKDFLRLKLSSQLAKKLRNINTEINREANNYLKENQNECLIKNIEYQKFILEREYQILKEMENELNNQEKTKKDSIVKSLTKKPTKYFK